MLGYCTPEEHQRFLRQCPIFERMLVEDGIRLHKYWFSVSDSEQQRRFESRLTDPMRRWKLSTTDIQSIERWEDYSRAKDDMMVHTDIAEARWNVVESDDKRRSRINMIAHLLSQVPYEDVEEPTLVLPERPPSTRLRAPGPLAAARGARLRRHPRGPQDARPASARGASGPVVRRAGPCSPTWSLARRSGSCS